MDSRIVYGARCAWWDSISEVGVLPPNPNNPFRPGPGDRGLPCCPHCGGVLFEAGSEAQWWESVEGYEATGEPGYRAFVEWLRGRCFPNVDAARSAYEEANRG